MPIVSPDIHVLRTRGPIVEYYDGGEVFDTLFGSNAINDCRRLKIVISNEIMETSISQGKLYKIIKIALLAGKYPPTRI